MKIPKGWKRLEEELKKGTDYIEFCDLFDYSWDILSFLRIRLRSFKTPDDEYFIYKRYVYRYNLNASMERSKIKVPSIKHYPYSLTIVCKVE